PHARRRLAAELQRVPDQVLEDRREQRGLPAHGGQRPGVDLRAALVDYLGEARERLAQHVVAGDDRLLGRAAPDAREREQVVDQLLHALGTVDREGDVLPAALVELVAVALLDQLAEARDLAQRLLQVVRGDIGELLQLRVRARQLARLLVELRVRFPQARQL